MNSDDFPSLQVIFDRLIELVSLFPPAVLRTKKLPKPLDQHQRRESHQKEKSNVVPEHAQIVTAVPRLFR